MAVFFRYGGEVSFLRDWNYGLALLNGTFLTLEHIQLISAYCQQVRLAQGILQEPGIELNHLLQTVEGVDTHAERLVMDQESDSFGARWGGQGA